MSQVGAQLQVGQIVALEEKGFGFVLALVPEGQPGHEVVEVAADYLALAEPRSRTRTRIPRYLVRVEGLPPASVHQPSEPNPSPPAPPTPSPAPATPEATPPSITSEPANLLVPDGPPSAPLPN